MFRKKIYPILLLICLLLNIFIGMDVFAVSSDKQVSIRVEGINSTIIKTDANYKTQKTTVYEALCEVLQSNDISVTVSDSAYGRYISSINGEEEATFGGYGGWMFIVNNETPDRSMDSYEIIDGDDIVVYYGGFDTYIPIVKLSKDTTGTDTKFIVTVTSTYYDWDKEQNITINLEGVKVGANGKTYYTDKNGKAVISASGTSDACLLNISQDRINNYPLIIRTTKNFVVTETDNGDGGNTEVPVVDVQVTAKEHLAKSLDYIYENTPDPTFGMGGGEWSILSLARGGYEVPEGYYEIYYNNVVSEVNRLMENPEHPNKLHRNKGTEHSRLILGLTSIGKDITNVGGYDIGAALADYNYIIGQGINGPVFALMALDTHNYEIPIVENVQIQSTRDMFVDYILDREIKKDTENTGGWALSGNDPDPNITSMVIQGLTPYYEKRQDVKFAIDRAVAWLSNVQKEDGDYPGLAGANSENIAQVVMALTGLGIDPHTDARFIKNGRSAIDALLTYAAPEGGFMHVGLGGDTDGGAEAGVVDGMATDQGTCALIAYNRLVEGKKPFYDMTDVKLGTIGSTNPEEPGGSDENETPLPGGNDEDDEKIPKPKKYATFSIDKFIINKGYVLEPTLIKFEDGESVWDVSKREMDKRSIRYTYISIPKHNSIYVECIDGDGEFDYGNNSGWIYNVNGWSPDYSASIYRLEDGDVVKWCYTIDLGAVLDGDTNEWDRPTTPVEETKDNKDAAEKELTDENENLVITDSYLNEIYSDSDSVSSWASEAVGRATQKGFVMGSDGKFNPKANITRAEFTKIIVAILGLDTEVDKMIIFTDVVENKWFYPYINAAYKAGIIKGSENKFNPDDNITREEMAVIIVRALEVKLTKSDITIKDFDKISDWAKFEVETAAVLGLMVGDNGNFDPKAFATREMATVAAMRGFDYKNNNEIED